MSHQRFRGYDVYCHVRNPSQVYQNIDEQSKEISKKEVKIQLVGGGASATLSELKKEWCGDYFKRYFELDATKGPLVLPQIDRGSNKIVDTMERWCSETNASPSNFKGLVVHNFDVLEFLKFFLYKGSDAKTLCEELEIKDRSTSIPIVIVYNPKEKVILLIRKSEIKDLSEEFKSFSNDMKIFMLLFGDECRQNKVKVICLLASNETTYENECEDCKKLVVPLEALESYESFWSWMNGRSIDLDIKNTEKIDEGEVIAVSEKLIGCLAAAPYFENIPTFTNNEGKQMEHVLMLLTCKQKDIIYSDKKHLIIRGPYGSGKSVVALTKFKILLKELEKSKKNEVAYFICYDSKAALLTNVERIPKAKVYRNERGKRLSELIMDILKETDTENVNLFVDEYDSENLDKEEAETLNRILEKNFKGATVVLILQSMVKERNVGSKKKPTKVEENKLDLLKMTMKDLDQVMRNPVQINNLISVTESFLTEEKTKYQYPVAKPASKDFANQKKEYAEGSAVFLKPKETVKKIVSQVENQNQPSIRESEDTRKSRSDIKDQTEFLEAEEDFAIAQLPRASNDDEHVIVNQYRYVKSTNIGHNVSSSENPELFEVDFQDTGNVSFEKLCALRFMFIKLNIHRSNSNNKHVILHFNTSPSRIPDLLTDAFQCLKINGQVTNNYHDFKDPKFILVCYFREFRGLEHSNVTVYIDQDMYNMQHYLAEVMARCTNKLSILVLQRSDALSKIIQHWENKSKKEKLIDHWKVQKSKEVCDYDSDYRLDKNKKLVKINFSSKRHKEMQQKFDPHEKRDFNGKRKSTKKAKESIQKRY